MRCPDCGVEVVADRLVDHQRYVHPSEARCVACEEPMQLSVHGTGKRFCSQRCRALNVSARTKAHAALATLKAALGWQLNARTRDTRQAWV
jgi:endogenous inhibitor of DNA gyrase (YacG/DUF329 family)